MFGTSEAVLILFVILLTFGAKRLPSLGNALGLGLRNFKKSLKEPDARDVEEIAENKNS